MEHQPDGNVPQQEQDVQATPGTPDAVFQAAVRLVLERQNVWRYLREVVDQTIVPESAEADQAVKITRESFILGVLTPLIDQLEEAICQETGNHAAEMSRFWGQEEKNNDAS